MKHKEGSPADHRPRRRRVFARAAGFAALGGGVSPAAAPPAAAGQLAGDPLVGSWYGSGQRASGVPNVTIWTFTSDGTVIRTTVDHPTRSPSHGSWERLGDRSYAYTYLLLLFEPDGTFAGFQEVRGRLALSESGAGFTTTAQSAFYDAAGRYDRPGSSTGTAIRIVVEPTDAPFRPALPLDTSGG